ncbi:MAG: MarR family transcriptional regulator [Wenzhouxiangellaceae bacterium]|nr:MarR family transcriptional regulator [Wenzhouxiangellaceae bacterium]
MADFELEHFLPYRLSLLSNRISNAIARAYRDRFDLSVTEWRVLAILGRHPGTSARDVARKSGMDKVAISRAVRRLLEAGRIEREPNRSDRRELLLRLSDSGRAIHDQVVPAALAFERKLEAALEPGEREQLDRIIDTLMHAAKAPEDER